MRSQYDRNLAMSANTLCPLGPGNLLDFEFVTIYLTTPQTIGNHQMVHLIWGDPLHREEARTVAVHGHRVYSNDHLVGRSNLTGSLGSPCLEGSGSIRNDERGPQVHV